MRIRILAVLFLAILLSAACSSSPPAVTSSGDASNGRTLFTKTSIGLNGVPGCATCHSLEKGKTLVGPSMAGIATEAMTIIKGTEYKGNAKTVEEYLRESITNPDAFVTKGFAKGIMPKEYGKLADQELSDLVAYLATLK